MTRRGFEPRANRWLFFLFFLIVLHWFFFRIFCLWSEVPLRDLSGDAGNRWCWFRICNFFPRTIPSKPLRSDANIATACLSLHNSDLALEHFNKALKICQKSLASQHPDLATIYNNMGGIYAEKRDFQQALSYFEMAANILY
jgi:tetratricopeptide (TPR) repeat protein